MDNIVEVDYAAFYVNTEDPTEVSYESQSDPKWFFYNVTPFGYGFPDIGPNEILYKLKDSLNMGCVVHFKPPIPYNNEYLSPPTETPKKDLIVFVAYIPVGGKSTSYIRDELARANGILETVFNGAGEQTNSLIRYLVFPTKNKEVKMECIYPTKELSTEETQTLIDNISKVIDK